MSTSIKSTSDTEALIERLHSSGLVAIWLGPDSVRHVERVDFLAAVAAECGVIIVDRAELPEVTEVQGRFVVDGETFMGDGDDWPARAAVARTFAMRDLALAEYLDAHPPVDEAQVEALTAAIESANGPGYPTSADLARRLVARGVRVEGGRA